MSISMKKLDGNLVEFTATVTPEAFDVAIKEAYKAVAKDVAMPGFRKGKVPVEIFIKKQGKEALYQDALDIVVSNSYREALEAHEDVQPVAYPKVDLKKFEPETEIEISIVVAVKPEVTLGDYKAISVEKETEAVTEEDIANDIATALARFSEMEIKDTPAVNGDTVVIDFEGFKDGVAFEGGKGENHSLKLGSNSFIPGFEEQLVGAKTDDTLDVTVTFPEEYHAEDLAGAEAVFKVTVHEVKAEITPELTDDIVKQLEIEDVETVADYKAHVEQQAVIRKGEQAESKLRADLIAALVDIADMDIPADMVDMQAERMLENFGQQLSMQGMNLEQYFQMTGSTKEDLVGQMRPDAEKQLKETLALEALVVAENIEASEEDLEAKYAEYAAMYQMEVAQLREMLPNLAEELKIEKAIDFLLANAK